MHVPDHVREDLMARANVVGVGVGPKRRGGRETGEEAVIVFVTEKLPESQLADEDICPRTVIVTLDDADDGDDGGSPEVIGRILAFLRWLFGRF